MNVNLIKKDYFDITKASSEFRQMMSNYKKYKKMSKKHNQSFAQLIAFTKERVKKTESSETYLINDLMRNNKDLDKLMDKHGEKVFRIPIERSQRKKTVKMDKIKVLIGLKKVSPKDIEFQPLILPNVIKPKNRLKTIHNLQHKDSLLFSPKVSSIDRSINESLSKGGNKSIQKINQTKEDCIKLNNKYHRYFNSHDYGINFSKQQYEYIKTVFE